MINKNPWRYKNDKYYIKKKNKTVYFLSYNEGVNCHEENSIYLKGALT